MGKIVAKREIPKPVLRGLALRGAATVRHPDQWSTSSWLIFNIHARVRKYSHDVYIYCVCFFAQVEARVRQLEGKMLDSSATTNAKAQPAKYDKARQSGNAAMDVDAGAYNPSADAVTPKEKKEKKEKKGKKDKSKDTGIPDDEFFGPAQGPAEDN